MKKHFYTALIVATILLVLSPVASKPAIAEEQAATITSTIPSEDYIVLNITGAATGDEVLQYIKAMDLQGNQIKRLKIVGDMTTYGNQGVYTFYDLEELELEGTSDVPSFLAYRAPKLTKLIDTSHTIKNIGPYAFAYSGLEDVELKNVDFLDTGAFRECLSLTSFKSSSLRSMNNWAFSGSSSLTIFEAPNLSVSFTSTALENTNIDTLDLPKMTSLSNFMTTFTNLKNLRVLKLNGLSVVPKDLLRDIGSDRLEYIEIKNATSLANENAFATGSSNISKLLILSSNKLSLNSINSSSLHANTVVAYPKVTTEQSLAEGETLTIPAFEYKAAPTTNVSFGWFQNGSFLTRTLGLVVAQQALASHSGTFTARFYINNLGSPDLWPSSEEHLVTIEAGTIGFETVRPHFHFEDYAISERNLLVKRFDSTTGILIRDNRSNKSDWEVHAKIDRPLTDPVSAKTLNNALVYVDSSGSKTPLTHEALPIFKSTAKNAATEILWEEDRGILLNIAGNQAFAGNFSTEIEWELVLAP
ncbi:hypothetical protein PGRAN_04671 [Listeria grandensis FSL F6-0971]|uniref:Uncharacterized protein n=1 Tax=Listeria grandensis FSL F6-0971 TaxID=1265819 RepID=W7BE51_9LIST|nr:leucine-rich repeat protein [Listeria grandensis]EUJ24217.1 hypothetical protein PGRAN_04671 [Listeria grandensis FSL F6-0971]